VLTEDQLLLGLASGEPVSTAQVYRQHYPTVLHWIQGGGGGEADAADIFQEAMVVLFEKSGNPDFRLTCKIGTYLFAIAKHLWFKKLERRKRQPVAYMDGAGSDDDRSDWAYEEDVVSHQEREAHYSQLDAALEQIGEPCRSLLKAFYHHDKSMQEIATNFGYTNPDNAKTQKYKCLTRLKKIFFNGKAT
jgi:RNA polymerase sigma factor (sigma-70 family)